MPVMGLIESVFDTSYMKPTKRSHYIYSKILFIFVIALAQFSLARLALYLLYTDQFANLGGWQVAAAFIEGMRFDLASITVFLSIPLLLLAFPLRILRGRVWQGIWTWIIFAALFVMTAVLIGDIVYFDFVKRHTAHELLSFGEGDANELGGMIFTVFLPYLLAFLVNSIILFLLWRRVSGMNLAPSRQWIRKGVAYIFFFFALVAAGRGGFGYKPIAIIDAFASGNTAYSNLVLNGVFSISQSSLKAEDVDHHFSPRDEALATINSRRSIPDPLYPFQNRAEKGSKGPYNLVFILVESLSFKYVDSFSGNNYGVTPNLDQMAAQGLKFTHFFANGQRSVEGIQATLTGIPSIIGLPTIGVGILAKYSKLGEMAEENGYTTIFVESLKRRSFRLDAIAGSAGFREFYGMEDIPILLDYPDPEAARWGWDYETYMKAAERMEAVEKPFLTYIVTGTTHTPYPRLPPKLEKYPHDVNKEEGFLNTVYYSDWGIGQLIERLKKQPWFDRTIFMITADHALAHYQGGGFKERFHVPLIVYAPAIFSPATVSTTWSQVDVFSSIIDILGLQGSYSSLGQSFFRPENKSIALVREGSVMGIIGDDGYLRHSLENRLETGSFKGEMPESFFNNLENQLLAADQLVFEQLKTNRWVE